MKTAWDIAKKAADKFGGTSKQYLAISMHMAWEQIKNIKNPVKSIVERLIEMGGKRWTKENQDRVYLDNDIVLSVAGYASTGIRAKVPSGKKFFIWSLKNFAGVRCFYDVAKNQFNFGEFSKLAEEFSSKI